MLMLTALRFSATAGREAERVEKKLKRGGKSGKWAERGWKEAERVEKKWKRD